MKNMSRRTGEPANRRNIPLAVLLTRRFAPSVLLACAFLLISHASAADTTQDPVPPQVQSAIDRGLTWLAKNQNDDGSWDAGRQRSMGSPSAALTSLAATAFMARGHVPGQGPYGENLNRAVDFVISLQKPNGLIADRDAGGPMYDHGISTVMLCESYGMLDARRQVNAKKAISRAVRLILNAQAVRKDADHQGGWRYDPETTVSDISVTGWQLMALRAAANAGAEVPKSAIDAGIAYIKRRATADGGFTYVGDSGATPARTGTGVLALSLLGQYNAPQVKAGGDFLIRSVLAHELNERVWYYYTMYYCSQAAYQLGGRYWDTINPAIRSSLLQSQERDGSWSANTGESRGGSPYATSMSILALTVPYRYLPLYQR